MIVTPEQLHLATQYPYDLPHESFLFVNGRALPIVDCGRDPLVDAQVHRGDDGTTFMDVRDLDGNILKISRAAEQ